MKIVAFIMSIYIFGLNLVPCEDIGTYENETKTEISQSFDHEHDHQKADKCSPFCLCQCCHVQMVQFQVSYITWSPNEITTQVIAHSYGVEQNFNTSILQPPQV